MECTVARTRLFGKIDGELSTLEGKELDAHLAQCLSCAREYGLLTLPHRIAETIPAFKPSPYFYQTLRVRIENEIRSITIWQVFLSLSRQVIPALAAVTLAFLSVFAYLQLRGSQVDLYQAYDRIFLAPGQSQRMFIADQGEITEESVLGAIADQESNHRQSFGLEIEQ